MPAGEPLQALFENKAMQKVKKDGKRLSVERIYQKKTQLEHILLRPDTYIGENTTISVWNNGKGIPVVEHKVEKVFVPALIFGQLLTSSNYDDEQKKVTGGRNGYGAKLCNIFSTKFTVETACREFKKTFKQSWYENMARAGESKIRPFEGEDFTCITFQPDLPKFKMETLDRDIVALMSRRAYDIAGVSQGVKVFLNGKRLPVSGFRSYVDLYLKDKLDETGSPLKVVHEAVSDRWEVCLTMSEKGFQQISFVNSIATTKGGRHVDYVADQIVTKLIEVVKRKNKAGVAVKPFQVKNHMWVFVNSLIENPTFDSQTKENMTLQHKSFGSSCAMSDKFIKAVRQGGKNSSGCTLILTEGDSAKTLAVSGLGVVGRDRYGVFPLRGKMLNVREATHKQIMENTEINNIIKIMGLQYKKNYAEPDSLKTLRYGKIMIMTDQLSLMMTIINLAQNFVGSNNLNLLQPVGQFGTRLHGGKDAASPRYIFTMLSPLARLLFPAVDDNLLKNTYDDNQKVEPEWYMPIIPTVLLNGAEGIGTGWACRIPNFDVREVVNNMRRMLEGEEPLPMLPSYKTFKGTVQELGPNQYLISGEISVLDSTSIEISELPAKTWTQRNDKREVKVAQLAGSVAEMSAYHHGELSLMMTIINLAQNFVGSNNLNLLQPVGQFGTRLHGGKDAASPRYIFTMLSPLARLLFPAVDDNLLKNTYDDNQKVEPEWYVPIIPTVLLNGAEGIGTGWACRIPNFDVREVVNNMRRMLEGEEPLPMLPSYKTFKGTVQELGPNQYLISGEISVLDSTSIEISELPAKTWTQLPSYKTFKGTVQELGPNQYLISGEISVLDSTSIEISELPAKTSHFYLNYGCSLL
ncbi:UNVERIFIED_CONTAM: hypothetical protein FKN15_052609 [Acipenser sinensis]